VLKLLTEAIAIPFIVFTLAFAIVSSVLSEARPEADDVSARPSKNPP
jgi:hypothetical protein